MSRIGKLPVVLDKGVTADISGNTITLKGPKGEMSHTWREGLSVAVEQNKVLVTRVEDDRHSRSFHGLTRSMISNIVTGVSSGYTRVLEVVGVGFKVEINNDLVVLSVGFTNPYQYKLPAGVTASVDKNNKITLAGIDKQKVGKAASEIRAIRPPEPYKGKGIKYAEEQIKRKVGKTSA